MDDPRNPIRFDPEAIENIEAEVEAGDDLTREELAWELVEVLDELSAEELSELVAKNVPSDTIEFFAHYAREFSEGLPIEKSIGKRLPNLMLLGYLLRVLEDRLLVEPEESFDA
jgi:hypothetical protein